MNRRDEVRERLNALAELAAAIAARDDADRQVLEERRTAIAGEVTTLRRARGAAEAYATPEPAAAPRFQDVEG
ncbi:MAG: hypothetical protein M5U20_03850 [Phycisphaerales bacterium]|nr:hypothetical protein [Phycisphaerales bacterium]